MPRNSPVQRSKPSKSERERAVLLSLVELYIKTGTPVGSNTLKEFGFKDLSSATIRNYFASLEIEGYLVQHHASGGRIPTEQAYKLFAHTHKRSGKIAKEDLAFLRATLDREVKEVSNYLQQSLEALAELSGSACFMLAPRFDQDYVKGVKLVQLDTNRLLCILMTDFGFVHTETIHISQAYDIEKIEAYFKYRIDNNNPPTLSDEESRFATQAYNEVVLRHIIAYSNFENEDIYKAGFAKLLTHREFKDLNLLSGSLSLFENNAFVRTLLSDCFRSNELKFWIGSDLAPYMREAGGTSLIAIPYFLNDNAVGALAILGPNRQDYAKIFATLEAFSKTLSDSLTKTLYKFKISYRNPQPANVALDSDNKQMQIEQL